MSIKVLIRLLVVLALFTGLAYWLNRPAEKVRIMGVASGEPLLPDLDVNAIHRMEISSMNATSMLVRKETGWTSETFYGYPARFDRVVDVLRKINDLKVGQVQREGERNLGEFGLDATAPVTDYMRITLSVGEEADQTIIDLGAFKHQRDASGMGMGMPMGRYVRVGQGPVVLVEELLTELTPSPVEWVEQELVRLQPDDIVSVSLIGTNDEFTIRRDDAGAYDIGRIDEGTMVDQEAVSRVMKVFQSLRFESVVDPALNDEQSGMALHEIATLRMRNELQYEFKFGIAREGIAFRPLRISVTYNPESGKPETHPDLVAEAEALNRRFAGHTFAVPIETADQVLTTRAKLVVNPTREKEEAETPAH